MNDPPDDRDFSKLTPTETRDERLHNASPPGAALLSPREAARLARVDEKTIGRWADKGLLKPVEERGRKRFAAEDIQRVTIERRTRTTVEAAPPALFADGELAAELFDAFDRQEHPVDVVKSKRLPARFVEANYADWQRLRGMYVVDGTQARTISGLLGRAVIGAEELLEALRQARSRFQCGACRRAFGEGEYPVCRQCAYTMNSRAAKEGAEHEAVELRNRERVREDLKAQDEHDKHMAQMDREILRRRART